MFRFINVNAYVPSRDNHARLCLLLWLVCNRLRPFPEDVADEEDQFTVRAAVSMPATRGVTMEGRGGEGGREAAATSGEEECNREGQISVPVLCLTTGGMLLAGAK